MNKSKISILENFKIIIPIIIFMIVSIMSIYSSQNLLPINYKNLYIKQLIWYLIGFIFLINISRNKNNILYEHPYILYWIFNILLILVLIFGTESNGARCWFNIPKLGSFQPSEFAKIALILVISKELDNYNKSNKKNLKQELKIILKCLIITLIPSLLAFFEPDTGIIFIFFSITISMIFIYGIRFRWFFIFGLFLLLIGIFFLILFFNYKEIFINLFGTNFFYRMDRLLDWQNGSGMQLTNALAATGSAGLFGYGYKKTPIYFPEPQTDFIFSIFSSNFGYIGNLALLILIIYFDMQLIKIAIKSNPQHKYIISGILAMLIFQQIQNIGMNIGLLPITGITLPFISYGGSSLVSYMIIIGLILNIQNKSIKI